MLSPENADIPGAATSVRPDRRSIPLAWFLIACALLTLIPIGAESIVALAIVLMEGTVALAFLAASALAGGWIVHALGLGRAPLAERMILGAGLGIGSVSLLVLGLGAAGLMGRPAAIAILVVLAPVGTARLILDFGYRLVLRRSQLAEVPPEPPPPKTPARRVCPLWLLVIPFLMLTLLAACLPPGVLWHEEGFGYDVLEYHLAVPREFLAAGRIGFLPHNVYSNFPLSSEMLSLVMMCLRGDPVEAAFMATIVNVGLAALLVAATWLAASRFGAASGRVSAILIATLPWTAYLAGIAYVEVGMLAMGMCALAALLRMDQSDRAIRYATAAGLLAGLACGFKYTALPLIAAPLTLLILGARCPARTRGWALGAYVGAGALAFSPWLIRNTVNTGNPVFPLAWSVFGAKAGTWDETLQHRWVAAHGRPEAEAADVPLWWRAVERTIGDFRMGGISFSQGDRLHEPDDGTLRHNLRYHVLPGALFILALAGALRRWDRTTCLLLAVLLMQAGVWFFTTHVFARFAVVLALPMALLAGRALQGRTEVDSAGADASPRGKNVLATLAYAVLVAGVMFNLYQFGGLYYDHTRINGMPVEAYGRTDAFLHGDWPGTQHLKAINELPAGSRVMFVGDARVFYVRPPCEYATVFNHHPLAEAIRRLKDLKAVVRWLGERGTTHVFVHWGEIDRLSRTYGFEPELDPDRDPTLYARLAAAGLKEVGAFRAGEGYPPYGILYEVPRQ